MGTENYVKPPYYCSLDKSYLSFMFKSLLVFRLWFRSRENFFSPPSHIVIEMLYSYSIGFLCKEYFFQIGLLFAMQTKRNNHFVGKPRYAMTGPGYHNCATTASQKTGVKQRLMPVTCNTFGVTGVYGRRHAFY